MNDDFLSVSLLQRRLHWFIASPHDFPCSENQPPVGNFAVGTEVSQVTLTVDWLVTVTLGAPHPQRVWVNHTGPKASGFPGTQTLGERPVLRRAFLKTPSACSRTYVLLRKQ